jgi:LAO/AO transport system kinase
MVHPGRPIGELLVKTTATESPLEKLFVGTEKGDRLSASRLMTVLENEGEENDRALRSLYTREGRSFVIGVTGWPGVGKSTLISRIAKVFLDQGKQVGIIAVDPSSPFSGGGLLGDRLRFRSIDGSDRLFIRSAASRGHQGGLSRATRAFVKVMEVMGRDVVIVETIGIGQEQVDISLVADTTVVVLAPGLGDYLQAIKSGIIEIGDIFVVNKADRPDAEKAVQDTKAAILMREKAPWQPPVVKTVAADGSGVDELIREIERHREYTTNCADAPATKARAAIHEILEAIKNGLLKKYLEEDPSRGAAIEGHAQMVFQRHTDPALVAETIFLKE